MHPTAAGTRPQQWRCRSRPRASGAPCAGAAQPAPRVAAPTARPAARRATRPSLPAGRDRTARRPAPRDRTGRRRERASAAPRASSAASRSASAASNRRCAAASRSRACRASLRVSISSARSSSMLVGELTTSDRTAVDRGGAFGELLLQRRANSARERAATCSAASRRFSALASCLAGVVATLAGFGFGRRAVRSRPPNRRGARARACRSGRPARAARRRRCASGTCRRTSTIRRIDPSDAVGIRCILTNLLETLTGTPSAGLNFWPSRAISTANSSAGRRCRWSIAGTTYRSSYRVGHTPLDRTRVLDANTCS